MYFVCFLETMRMFSFAVLVLISSFCYVSGDCNGEMINDEEQAQQWLDDFNREFSHVQGRNKLMWWNWATNMTDHNFQLASEDDKLLGAYVGEALSNVFCFNWKSFTDPLRKREFKKINVGNNVQLEQDDAEKLAKLKANLGKMFDKGEVCAKPGDADKNKCYGRDPDLIKIFKESRDWDELVWAWKGWRDATGKLMREDYKDHVVLMNKQAKLEGFSDAGDSWRDMYENDNLEEELKDLFKEVMTLYKPLHAYMRRKLKLMYPNNEFPESGHIPAHLLGNIWAEAWNNLIDDDLIVPYPGRGKLDITNALKEKNFTVTQIYEAAETFYMSLGFDALPQSFWDDSMLEKPDDREVICSPSASDFLNGKDFRIKYCTHVNHQSFMIVYHEMGHIYHYIEYKDQPVVFRDGPNPAVTEAIGDMILLSAATPAYLHSVGLKDSASSEYEDTINYLMLKALEVTAFLPFGYLVDQWRWGVFSGKVKPENYNEAWWDLRCRIQGLSPPVTRSEDDLDPGSKMHVAKDVPYVKYFLSLTLMFQYQKSLCDVANYAGPLHECNLHGSTAAGDKLREILRIGSSVSFPENLKIITNSEKISAQALIEYFQPLIQWLEEQNEGVEIGWDDECPEGSFWSDTSSTVHLQLSCSLLPLIALATIAFNMG